MDKSNYILKCTKCGEKHDPNIGVGTCIKCGGVLLAEYDIEKLNGNIDLKNIASQWRYRDLLPIEKDINIISLNEGYTPLLKARNLGNTIRYRGSKIYIKDESRNPTGTFKDRGISTALSRWSELGYRKFALATAGNAGISLASYSRVGGFETAIYAPRDTPKAILREIEIYDADLITVEGTIFDASRKLRERIVEDPSWINISTGMEPYRFEGDKTIGLEILEHLDWKIPDIIVYPLGGGEGIIGIWKAVKESIELGLVKDEKYPRFIAAQPENCAPIARALKEGKDHVDPWTNCRTIAIGLNIPKPYADYLIIDILKKTRSLIYTIGEAEILESIKYIAAIEGIYPSPETAAGFEALRKAIENNEIDRDENIVVIQTASGVRYLEILEKLKN